MEILEECINQSLMENPREIFLFLVQMKQADKLISREKIPMPCIHPKDMILGNTVLEIQNISELKKMRGGVPASISDIPYIEVGSKRRDHVIYPFTFEFDIDPKEVGRPFFGIDSVEFPNHKKQIS
ncbi:MAG: hypothetical protein H6791_00450 [Candidatus Nomurabacteria bacterium]|nr:MAG: hypothetical protein H6791_00450 [Candidatus Nomurabacteria bacterium]